MSDPGRPILDTRGELCPRPIIDLAQKIKELAVGEVLEVLSDDAAFPYDVEAWCAGYGHDLLDVRTEGRVHRARIRRARA